MRPDSSKLAPACFILAISLVLPCYAHRRLDGGIHGTVRDGLGSPLSGVIVIAVDAARRRFTTSTDQQGNFRFLNLAAGRYSLTFNKGGFKEKTNRNLLVLDGQSTDGSVTLEIGSTSPTTLGSISGTATDASGSAVSGARVTATNMANGLTFTAIASDDGRYSLTVPAGNYTVVAEAAGFRRLILTPINVEPGGTVGWNITLEVGATTQPVTVTATAGESLLIDHSAPGTRDIFGPREIEDLPLINRSYEDLLELVSGATTTEVVDTVNHPGISMSGARAGSNNFNLDGTDNNQNGLRLAQIQPLPFGTIQELSVADFYDAEFGRYSGSLINTVTRGGGNYLYGSLYYFHLNSSLAARDFFDLDKSRFLKNDFGFTLGGPAVEDHLFFFGGYEGKRELDARPRLTSVPSQARLAEARSIIAAAGLAESRLGAQLLRLFPPPDSSSTFNNRFINSPAINDTDAVLIRADYNRTSGHIYARYDFSRADALFPMAPSFFPGFRTDSSVRRDGISISYDQTFGLHLQNDARFVFHRDRQSLAPEDRSLDPASLGLNTGVVDSERFGLPLIKITGFDALGAPFSIPSQAVAKTWHLVDTFSGRTASHYVKGGFDFRRVYINSRNDSGTRGRIAFDGSVLGDALADFIAGLASGNTAIVRGDTQRGTAVNSIHLFAQDSYRVRPNLTLSLGLRYEFDGVIHEDEDRLSNFIGPSVGLVQVGSQQLPKLYENDLNNFAPRLAVAWDPTDNGLSLVRANWGVFYDSPSQNLFIGLGPFTNSAITGATTNPVGPDPVFAISPSTRIRLTPGVSVFGDPSNPATRVDIFAVEPNLNTPYLQKFSLSISRQFLQDYAFEIAYVGSVGSHLYRVIDFNQPTPGDPASRDARRPFSNLFPRVSAINMLISAGKSNYHALRATVKRRFSRGLSFYARYTFSKSIDDASTANELPQDSRNLRSERAVSSFDQRHRFVLDWIYRFPHSEKRILDGWQISGIFKASSGSPFTPTISIDNSGTGTFADRPNQVGDPRSQMRDATRRFDAAAFEIPPGTVGNAGRNSLVGPGLNSWDVSLNKETVLRGDVRCGLRVDFFNLFNHPNFGMPDRFVDEPSFGSINVTNTFNARRKIQIGARIIF